MSRIDCSVMSHPACYAEAEEETAPVPEAEVNEEEASAFGSYDCVNDCVSSLGVPGLVAGAIAGLSCVALTPAGCALVVVGAPSLFAAACNDACVELEGK